MVGVQSASHALTIENEAGALSDRSFDIYLSLWTEAMALPTATPAHFRDPEQYSPAHAAHLRLVSDPGLRDRLIAAGMAELVDVRRGRQPRTQIVRLRPALDATRQRACVNAVPAPLPTVEELRELVATIVAREAEILSELASEQNAILEAARAKILRSDGEELEDLVRRLRCDMRTPAQLRSAARVRAIAILATDRTFELRRHLSLIRPDVDDEADLIAGPAEVSERERLRAASQREWEALLTSVLTTEWQSSRNIARSIGRTHDTVLGRLKDMMRRELVERKIVKSTPPTSARRRRPTKERPNTARLTALFRLR